MTETPTTKPAHNPGFLALVEDAKQRVRTLSIEEFIAKLQAGERYVLVDTREDREWDAGHLPSAHHLGKGVIERDVETAIPDKDTPIVAYCGGGFRSVLVADNLQKMGYTNVLSLDGGWRGWNERGLPVVTPEARP
ncbi:MAG: sulfurtransferase [Candidatus Eisenbacteria bacterium]|uniref:Sulfurtransferase n=1 Tax=Eiseniibacteriota bacterium TaxID=2212470 RepID=A0A933SE65_UNCEI|nr:sulfurtransferase [Candidatus Eisenbacteria bacterium]